MGHYLHAILSQSKGIVPLDAGISKVDNDHLVFLGRDDACVALCLVLAVHQAQELAGAGLGELDVVGQCVAVEDLATEARKLAHVLVMFLDEAPVEALDGDAHSYCLAQAHLGRKTGEACIRDGPGRWTRRRGPGGGRGS